VTTSPVVETVSRKRVLSSSEVENEKTSRVPDFWEYIESLKPEQWTSQNHIVYLYRQEPKTTTYPGAPPAYLDKYVGEIEVRPGYSVPMNDAGTVQQAIKDKFGGRVFRMILKRGSERLTEATFSTEAQPKYPDTTPQYANQSANPPATDASVASKAIDAMASQQPDAVRLAMDVLRSASEIVMRQSNPPAPQPPPARDPLIDALLQKALNPPLPPDPFAMFVRFKEVLGPPPTPATNGLKDLLDLLNTLKTSGIVSLGAPAVGRTSLLDIGRELVPVFGTVMHEYRLSREADARIAEIQRSGMQPSMQTVQPNPPAAVPQLPPVAPTPPAVAPQPPPAPALTFQQIENHIAKIVKNVEYTVDEAVDKVLEFLYDTDPRIVVALLNPPSIHKDLKPGKDGLMMLFTYEPELKDCLSNVPRLSEFLDKFIVAATEEETNQMRLRAAAPANAATVQKS
jgi:hypothetical protein